MTPSLLKIDEFEFVCGPGIVHVSDDFTTITIPNEIFIKMAELFLKGEKEKIELKRHL